MVCVVRFPSKLEWWHQCFNEYHFFLFSIISMSNFIFNFYFPIYFIQFSYVLMPLIVFLVIRKRGKEEDYTRHSGGRTSKMTRRKIDRGPGNKVNFLFYMHYCSLQNFDLILMTLTTSSCNRGNAVICACFVGWGCRAKDKWRKSDQKTNRRTRERSEWSISTTANQILHLSHEYHFYFAFPFSILCFI